MKVVGIIGAGAAGLCALRHFNNLTGFTPVIWEKSKNIGGTWVYTEDLNKDEHGLPVHSSMYKSLKTNLPKEVMGFPDFPFESGGDSFIHHTKVLQYLQDYAKKYKLEKHIKFEHLVEHVTPCDASSSSTEWEVRVRDLNTSRVTTTICHALMVCNGHYSDPVMPSLRGIERYSGYVEHSHRYREPHSYTNKTVLVLGAAASGLDISLEMAKVAKKVYLSHNQPVPLPSELPLNMEQVPGAVALKEDTDDVFVLKGGREVAADALLYCTGYHYTFPFLDPSCNVSVVDNQVRPLYRHLVHCDYPSMAFLGIPFQICPFPFFDVQVRYLVRVLCGETVLPSTSDMSQDAAAYRTARLAAGKPARHLHQMGELQWRYNDALAELANLDKIPTVVEKLYDHVHNIRKDNLMTYKTKNYSLLDNENFKANTR